MSCSESRSYADYLEQVFHTLFFDSQHLIIDERSFAAHYWYDFYRDAKEAIPADAPTPRVNVVSAHCFVDADHDGNRATRI